MSMDPQSVDLKTYGIDVGLLMSGLFGAILLTSKGSAMNLARTVYSLVGGAASANYITPVVVSFTKLNDTHFHYAIAFLLGFLGLKGVEYFSVRLIPDEPVVIKHESPEPTPLYVTKKRRRTK